MMLAVDVPVELFDDSRPRPAVFTPDGAALDRVHELDAGPWLAVMIADCDVRSMTEFDLVGYVESTNRLVTWALALQTEAIAELASRPQVSAEQEVAFALREPLQTAQRRIWIARRLRRLPRTRDLFRRGVLPWPHVQKVVEATSSIDDPDLLTTAEERVYGKGLRHGATELRRAFRDVLNRLDPRGATGRAEHTRTEATDVTVYDEQDGVATVCATMPTEDALIVKTACDAYAMAAKNAGDPRRVGVLRAALLTRLCADHLTGARSLPVTGRLPPSTWHDGIAGGRPTVGGQPTVGGRPIEIGITLGLRTALGLDELPAEIPGRGLIPRSAVQTMLDREAPRLRLLVIDEATGRLVHRAETSYRPTPAQYAHVHAAYPFSVGPASNVPSARCDLDHPRNWPASPTRIEDLVPVCRPWHNSKTHQQVLMRVDEHGVITWTTPTGQQRSVAPHDYR